MGHGSIGSILVGQRSIHSILVGQKELYEGSLWARRGR